MEQGQVEEAAKAYQEMVNQRPDPHSYSRVAHIRWLKGDLDGAIKIQRLAAGSMSPRAPEAAAWAHTRLASHLLQDGQLPQTEQACRTALDYVSDYPPALLVQSRLFMEMDKPEKAIDVLHRAGRQSPLPEYQWALADALRAVNRLEDARLVEERIRGLIGEDPRTVSLFLATRGEETEIALGLAEEEMAARQDVFTLDALAWAYRANGQLNQAHQKMRKALAEGTRDARLFFHAGVIAAERGEPSEALQWLREARALEQTLFPSEREQLHRTLSQLSLHEAG